jgi:hypothetical protein
MEYETGWLRFPSGFRRSGRSNVRETVRWVAPGTRIDRSVPARHVPASKWDSQVTPDPGPVEVPAVAGAPSTRWAARAGGFHTGIRTYRFPRECRWRALEMGFPGNAATARTGASPAAASPRRRSSPGFGRSRRRRRVHAFPDRDGLSDHWSRDRLGRGRRNGNDPARRADAPPERLHEPDSHRTRRAPEDPPTPCGSRRMDASRFPTDPPVRIGESRTVGCPCGRAREGRGAGRRHVSGLIARRRVLGPSSQPYVAWKPFLTTPPLVR